MAGLVLFVWVACCSQRQRPRFCGIVPGSELLLFFCGLPYVLCWTLRPILSQLLPLFLPLATLLAWPVSTAAPSRSSTSQRLPAGQAGATAGGPPADPGGGGPAGGGRTVLAHVAQVEATSGLPHPLPDPLEQHPPCPTPSSFALETQGLGAESPGPDPPMPSLRGQGKPENEARDIAGKQGAPRTGRGWAPHLLPASSLLP